MATYAGLNPQSVLRDALLDPTQDIASQGLAYPKIFGVPALPSGTLATGRAIDLTGDPGTLHGKLLVRARRNILGAAAGKVAQAIGAARDVSNRFDRSEVAFSMKQFAGRAEIGMEYVTHGYLPSAEEEYLLVQQSMDAVHIKAEKYVSSFFTTKAAEGSVGGRAGGGWTELDWQDAAVGGTDLDQSTDAMDVLHSIIQDARLRGGSPVNAIYMGRRVAEKLAREASVLGRIIVKSGGAADGSVSAFQGQRVAPLSFVEAVLSDHFEIPVENIVIGSATHNDESDTAQDGTNGYIWPSDRLWVGNMSDVSLAVGGGRSPRVISGAGAGCMLIGKLDTAVGPEAGNMPQKFEAISEMFMDCAALDTSKGTLVHNLG